MKGIEVKNLTKAFREIKALDNVSLSFEENRIYGLLGRNGAGKTTLLNTITGKIFADSGQLLMDGNIIAENQDFSGNIFMMNEKNYYPEGMRVGNAIKLTKEFYPDFDTNYCMDLAKKFGLNTNKKIKSLSTGYGSIFKLIITLSTNAPYLFFDEPVLGLDANHRDIFYKSLLQKYSEKPFTAIISTHLIGEVADLLEYAVIIDNGKIIKIDSVENLLSSGCTISGTAPQVDDFIRGKKVLGFDSIGGLKTAYLLENPDPASLAEGIEVSRMDLQQLFIHLTNQQGGEI